METVKIPKPVQQSFAKNLLNVRLPWISEEDFKICHKINGFGRHGLKRFPRIPKYIRDMDSIQKTMPPQGGQTLRLRRFDRPITLPGDNT